MASREPLVVRLRRAFLEDLEEQLGTLNADLLALEAGDAPAERLKGLFRAAHTLKGASRAASLPAVEQLCHAMEEALGRARDGSVLGPGDFRLLFAAADALAAAARALRAGAEPDADRLAPLTAALQFGGLHDLPDAPPVPPRAPQAPPPEPAAETAGSGSGSGVGPAGSASGSGPASAAGSGSTSGSASADGSGSTAGSEALVAGSGSASDAGSTSTAGPTSAAGSGSTPNAGSGSTAGSTSIPGSTSFVAGDAPAAGSGDGRVRVEAERLDALLATVEQLLLARARVESRLPEARALRDALERAARTSRSPKLNGAGRAADEAARERAREAGRLSDALSADVRALAQVTGELSERARRVRMRPFADAAEALPRTVRDVAAASGKEARLMVLGGSVEADRAVIDAMREALLHLARNAVDHGIEPPDEREAKGKPRAGTVTVAAALRGEQVVVTVTDDGRGLDMAAVRAALARQGRAAPEDDHEAARTLFEPGFSTQERATEISGRGVGLDAARAALERVRGRVRVEWMAGAGTVFTLECPLTLATLRAFLVRVDGHAVALPAAGVDHLARVRPDALRRAEDREVVATAAGPVPIVPLARVLGPPLMERAVSGPFAAVHLRDGDRRLAVAVDEAEGERELVVRPLPRGRVELPLLGGAALLPTGEVALVANVAAVVAAGLAPGAGAALRVEQPPEARTAGRRILVVDDSITTRTLEQSTLEAAGFEVATAVDGEDGWRILQAEGADLVVSDVEMPRMDGFALCEAIRASPRFAHLPVVLVTSLESEEHRARGLEAGADAYVGKSGFDQQGLLDTIRRLLG